MASLFIRPHAFIYRACSQQRTVRAMDLITPIGMAAEQIVAPPGSAKRLMLKHICQAVTEAHPDIKLYALLIDERPEEVTDFKRGVSAEVHALLSDLKAMYTTRMAYDMRVSRQATGIM